MNPEIPACIKCPVKCKLEDESARIIEEYKPGDVSDKNLNTSVSRMSQMAHNIPCPSSEIEIVRIDTFTQTNPKLIKGSNAHLFVKSRPRERDYE